MKISKLFHWLYAILMLMPAFAIGVTCAYAIFNKNAYLSNTNITNATLYNLNGTYNQQALSNNYLYTFQFNGNSETRIGVNVDDGETNLYELANLNKNNALITSWNSSHPSNSFIYVDYIDLQTNQNRSTQVTLTDGFEFYCRPSGNIMYWGTSPTNFNQLNFFISYTIYTNGTLDNVFYYSINKVQQSPLFNWAYDSFLATPITYITSLFGMPDNNIAILLMSYWLDISIIYLVFDMIMYVPLLVHRWLDKGVLE